MNYNIQAANSLEADFKNRGIIITGLTQLAQIGSGGSRATGQFQLNQAHRNTWAFELLY